MPLRIVFVNDHHFANIPPKEQIQKIAHQLPADLQPVFDEVSTEGGIHPFIEEANSKIEHADIVVLDGRLFTEESGVFNGWHNLLPQWLNGKLSPPFGGLWLETAAYHKGPERARILEAGQVAVDLWNNAIARAKAAERRLPYHAINTAPLAIAYDVEGGDPFPEWVRECAHEIERHGRDW